MRLSLNKIFIIPLMALMLTSCDDYLDITPTGSVIITTAEQYRKMLTHAYSVIPEDRGLATFRSDEFLMDATISKEDINSYKDIWIWNDISPDESTSTFNWRRYYQVIYEANYTLESRNNITEGSAKEVDQLIGESYMLRAYMHFLLVNLFGEPYTAVADPYSVKAIPLKLNTESEDVLPRNTLGEVFDQIISDLDNAERYMNIEQWQTGLHYRFNTVSVDALRSRVYLYMGKWEESLVASRRVLEKRNELSDLSSELPNDFNSAEIIVALEQTMTAAYFRAGKVNTELWRSYNSADQRRSKYYRQVTASNIQLQKGGSNQYACSFRTGEIYMNAAEAALETEGEKMAREYLLKVMQSRYTAAYYTQRETAVVEMNKEELLTEILAERRRELAFEGHRWFDLRRRERKEITKTYLGETFTLNENDSRYTIRIPSDAIAANPGLAN